MVTANVPHAWDEAIELLKWCQPFVQLPPNDTALAALQGVGATDRHHHSVLGHHQTSIMTSLDAASSISPISIEPVDETNWIEIILKLVSLPLVGGCRRCHRSL